MKKLLIASLFTLPLVSFNSFAVFGEKDIKQDHICHVSNGVEAKKQCKDGDVLMWLPNSFGNEQYPVLYTALFCDFTQQVTHTVGGTTCIFTSKRKAQWAQFGVE
ncbi:hypothetical protein [Enterovibrio norvegicus]|uniref:hypothetical protein n=1 Tax=Enterovibrio norvegicus TaxID=188144 RepID=UPI000C858BF0|nr:hypothetical protein [Enterovibrio norvegicus]PML76114.1 hypothetical protein BCT69_05565 [Enterovibrio norvegicus]PMN68330.1 hypothetical protein BCT27_24110 [Enterovibrio norvegicus]